MNGSIEAISPDRVRVGMTSQVWGPSAFTVRLDPFDMHLSNDIRDEEKFQVAEVADMALNARTLGKRQDQTKSHSQLLQEEAERSLHATFLTLAVPKLVISGTSDMTIDPQIVAVENASELSTFLVRAFIGEQESGGSLRVHGSTTARLGLLSTSVKIDKVVHFSGMNHLDGTNVTHTEAVTPFAEDGTNIHGTLLVANTSPFTLSLGNVTCTVVGMMPGLLEGYMGNTTVNDLVIRPGNETVEYRGQLDATAMSSKMMAVPMNKDVQETGLVQIAFQGKKSVIDGEQIHYLDEVLSKLDVLAGVPIEVGTKVVWEKLSSFNGDW